MKKRLLITSIVMMLVVAVALSTATYAWFTSNANVTANSIVMTASTNTAPSIGIAWTNESYGTEIFAISPTHDSENTNSLATTTYFDPMVPSASSAIVVGTTAISTYAATGGVDFYSATIKDTPTKFNDDVKTWTEGTVAPYVWNNGTQKSFFLKNQSDTFAMSSVTLNATITGDGADLLRVAVFARIGTTANTAPTGNYTLKKILVSDVYDYTLATAYTTSTVYYTSAGVAIDAITDAASFTAYTDPKYTRSDRTTAYTVGGFEANDVVGDEIVQLSTAGAHATSVDLGALGANCIAELIVYVWTDGTALVDSRGGQAASVQLDFTATKATV